MKYSRCDNINKICTDSLNNMTSATTTNTSNISNLKMTMSPVTSSGFLSDLSPSTPSNSNAGGTTQFSDELRTVESLYEKWSDCQRTVVLYALLKRLRYPCLKFLHYSIDNNLTQHAVSQSTMDAVIADINANNPSYLQNLFNAYNTFHLGDIVEGFSSTSSSSSSTSTSTSSSLSSCASDKESMPCYGSADFQLKPNGDERKPYAKKEDVLHEVLNILPLLKPGNEDAKTIYLSLIPSAVKDAIKQIVPPELVQQIFSYLLIHPAVTSEDRRSFNVWFRQLEDFLLYSQRAASSFFMPSKSEFHNSNSNSINEESLMVTSVCSASSSCSSSSMASCNSVNANISVCGGNNSLPVPAAQRSTDWQTIAPPAKYKQQQQHYQLQHQQPQQQQKQQPKAQPQLSDWCDALTRRRQSCGGGISTSMTDQLCDNFNGIKLDELGTSHSNNLGLSSLVGGGDSTTSIDGKESSSLVNGVVAAAASAEAAAAASQSSLFGVGGGAVNNISTNPIINIIGNSNNEELISDDHDTSFSKNGTDFDFEPPNSNCNSCSNSIAQFPSPKEPFGASQPFSSLFVNNGDQLDANRWSLDSKIAALKTRRSNSLTTQTISTSSNSSSNSSVVTVNDNCSNSTENLAQFANKPRSFSLSIENQQRGVLINGGSDTRLDDFKPPNYIKFQTRNVGMSNIGTWLKSLRLHKYVELFYNLTYEDMLQITEEYLQNLGVTKGASHKLALCIEKLKERSALLAKLEQDLMSGKHHVNKAIEELTNLVLTPMKPIDSIDSCSTTAENIALQFLRVTELVCSIVQRDPYVLSEDESLNSIVWILDRAMHSDAFISHMNQLKDLKFQISKLKIAFAPRLHYTKTSGGNTNFAILNKTRWNGKPRKCDSKNGSNDRINYRKNSGDMLNFPAQQNGNDFPQQMANGGNENNSQYKNPSFSNYMNQHTQQLQVQVQVQQHQPQQQSQQQQYQQPHIAQQQNHFPSLPQPSQQQKHHMQLQQQQQQQPTAQHQHQLQQQQQQNGRSLSNLIVVSGGQQQSQKVVFKPSGQQQGVLSMSNSIRASADNLQSEKHMHHQQQQQRKGSLASVLNYNNNNKSNMSSMPSNNNNGNGNGNGMGKKGCNLSTSSNAFASSKNTKTPNSNSNTNINNNDSSQQQQQQQQLQHQQQKKTMAAVVMVSNENPSTEINSTATEHVLNGQQIRKQSQQQQQHSIAIAPNEMLLSSNDDLLSDNNNLISEQQLQLLAAAAAAAAVASCSSSQNNPNSISNNNNSKNNGSHNNNNNNTNTNNDNSCDHCSTCNNCCNRLLPVSVDSNAITNLDDNTHTENRTLFNDSSPDKYEDFVINITTNKNLNNNINDMRSLEHLETLCLQMTEQAIN